MARPTERRRITNRFEVRAQGDSTVVEGHAAVWNTLSQNLGGFVEQVARGAFTKTIAESDVRALVNHDENLILGRNTAGTLDLAEDNSGLYYRVTLGSRSYERDLAESMERGDVNQSSFAFSVIEDEWGYSSQDFPMRTLKEVRLFDVSPVTYPAYLDSDSGLAKRAIARLAEKRGLDPNAAVDLRALIDGSAVAPTPETSVSDDGPGAPTHSERIGLQAELEAKRLISGR